MGLETVEIVLWAEREFDLKIPDEDVANLATIGALVNYLAHRSKAAHGTHSSDAEYIFDRLSRMLQQQYSVPESEIHLDARFYDDLGLG